MSTTCKLIAKVALTSTATTIEFSSIPGTYTDLFLVASLRTDRPTATSVDIIKMTFNGSSTGYTSRRIETSGTYIGNDSTTLLVVGIANTAGSTTANTFASMECYIPNYAGSTNKSLSSTCVMENNSASDNSIQVNAGLWSNTAAITTVTLAPLVGPNFVSGSSAYLYGITKSA